MSPSGIKTAWTAKATECIPCGMQLERHARKEHAMAEDTIPAPAFECCSPSKAMNGGSAGSSSTRCQCDGSPSRPRPRLRGGCSY